MFENIIEKFYKNIFKYKYILLLILFISSLYNIINLNKFKLDASADTLILENDKDYKIFKDINKTFTNKPFLVLAYKASNKKIDREYINNISQLKIKLESIKGIDSTFSIIDAPILTSTGISLNDLNINNIKTITSDEINFNKAIDELKKSPIFQDQIINSEGNVTAIILYLKEDKNFNNIINLRDELKNKIFIEKNNKQAKQKLKEINLKYEIARDNYNRERHNLIIEIRKILKELNLKDSVFLGGVAMIADDSLEFIKKDIINFGAGVLIFIIIILFLLFKNIKWVILPILTTSFCLLTIIGSLILIGWKVTVISSNFISLIIILTISMNIHIIVRYQIIYNKKNNDVTNIFKTMKEMFAPCIYTSLTTIVAFLSLVFSDIRPVIDFGLIMTIGLLITFLSSFIVLPCLISLFPHSENYKIRNLFIINKLFLLVTRFGSWIIFTNIIIIIITIWGIQQLKVENSFINYFKKNTDIYKGMKLIDKDLGGTTPIDLIIEFKNEDIITNKDVKNEENIFEIDDLFNDEQNKIDYWLTTDKLETIKDIHNYLENKSEIGKVQSIQQFINLAELINKNPLSSFELAIIYKSLPTEMKEDLLGSYIALEKDTIRFTARIIDSNDIQRNELIKDINKDLQNKYDNVESIKVNGLLVLYNNMLQSLFSSQIKSLTFVLILIFFMFLILFRSFILSLAGIIPNIIASLFILGLIGLFRIPLDMMTITIAAITIGIAVDNSIHYIYRIKKELQNHDTLIDTINKCHQTVGNAILTTSITIAFGFSILLLSNFLPTIYFGIFTGIAMIIAMLGIMTTLPKILILLKIK